MGKVYTQKMRKDLDAARKEMESAARRFRQVADEVERRLDDQVLMEEGQARAWNIAQINQASSDRWDLRNVASDLQRLLVRTVTI